MKKWLVVLGGIIALGGLILSLVFLRPKEKIIPSFTQISTPAAEKLLVYEDEAGFSFQYPESAQVTDVSGEKEVYSELKITSTQHPGEMKVEIIDSKYASTEDWLEKAPQASTAGVSRQIGLGGMAGRQVQLNDPRRLITLVIDRGVLFYLESSLEEPAGTFWNQVHNHLVSSFQLEGEGKSATTAGGSSSAGGEVIYEEEEVIE